jgi:hypothetical protein
LLGTINIYDAARTLPDYASLAAVLSFGLLLVLYFSQRRDLERLRIWMERDPSHPATDLSASEALLDRAEADLETVLGTGVQDDAWDTGVQPPASEPTLVSPPTPATPAPASGSGSAAARVTGERPALERITTERAALQPHPRWHRLLRRIGQPRVLGLVALLAVVLGIVAIFGSERLIQNGEDSGPQAKPGAIVPGDVEVAVLNGTSVPGLAGKVGDDVQVNGFKLGTISNSRTRFDQTVVMYEAGQRRAAKRVAHDLGVQPVQKIDRQTEQAAGGADVVVIAGADRAKP